MKIAVVSDTHDNLSNLRKAIDWIKSQNIKLILHCGDISRQETIDFMEKEFCGPASAKGSGEAREIKYVKGNADYGFDFPEKMELEIVDPPTPEAPARRRKIALTHFPDIAKKMAQSGKFDLVFYGHTHRPWDEKILECHMINPGEMANQFYKPTFAVYDTITLKLELKILDELGD